MIPIAGPALAALGSAGMWALGAHLFARSLQRRSGERAATPAAANLFKNLLAITAFALCVPFAGTIWPGADTWPLLLLSGFFGFAIGDTLFFAALPRVGVQVTAMVSQIHVPAAVLLAWLVRGERLEPWTLAATAVVISGICLVVLERPLARPEERRTRRIGVACAALAAVSQAVGVVLGHGAMDGVDVLSGTIVRMLGGIAGAVLIALLVMLAFALLRRGDRARASLADLVAPLRPHGPRRGLLLAALFGSVLGLPLFHYALRQLPSGVSAVLFATTPLFTLPIGALFGERHGPRAIVGTLIGFVGVAGVVWSLRTSG